MKNIIFATAIELADAIRQGEVSSVKVLEAHLEQISRCNPVLNAIVTVDLDGARKRAKEADEALARGEIWGALHGVPVTIKDSIGTKGMRTTSGFPPLADFVPSIDATVVARIRAAGAIIIGKTNLPVFAGDIQTDNPIFGRTNNPWDITRTPGGSTGGGAAAVASGMTPLELGSDIGGSVRLPAHYCGVYTLKPTDHLVPTTGHIPEPSSEEASCVRHMCTIGPLARSVDDLTLALKLIAGPDGHEWEVPPVPLEPVTDIALSEISIAWTDDFGGVTVSRDTKTALAEFAGKLEKRGCRIERRVPDGFDFTNVWETWGEMIQAEVGSIMSPEEELEQAERHDFTVDSDVPVARGMARMFNATMRQYTETLMKRDALITAIEQFFDRWDVLLCPVSVSPAFKHCPTGTPVQVDGNIMSYWMAGGAYTTPFNLTGSPVVVLPLARSSDGLPIGIQVVGRRWSDMRLLAIAARLSEVTTHEVSSS